MSISERIRPGIEAADWVCVEVGKLEASYEALKQQLVLVQNRMDWEADRAAKLDVALEDTQKQLAECQANEIRREKLAKFHSMAKELE